MKDLEEYKKEIVLNILGTEWTVYFAHQEDDNYLKNADGYTDKTVKKIVVTAYPTEDSELEDWNAYMRKNLRHEILHAYLYESGLGENFTHPDYGHDEVMIDYVAIQFPKLMKTYKEAGAL